MYLSITTFPDAVTRLYPNFVSYQKWGKIKNANHNFQ